MGDDWTTGLPLLCGEWRTDRNELGLHRDRHSAVRLQRANSNTDGYRYGNTNTNTNADANADTYANAHTHADSNGKHIRQYFLLFESSPWPSAKCYAHFNW